MKRHNRVERVTEFASESGNSPLLVYADAMAEKISIAQNTRTLNKSRMLQGYTIAQFQKNIEVSSSVSSCIASCGFSLGNATAKAG